MDLGGHVGAAKIRGTIESDLVTIHYHFRSFKEYTQQAEKILLSHGYIKKGDSRNTMLEKLEHHKKGNSCHRVNFYIKYLISEGSIDGFYKDNAKQKTERINLIRKTISYQQEKQ